MLQLGTWKAGGIRSQARANKHGHRLLHGLAVTSGPASGTRSFPYCLSPRRCAQSHPDVRVSTEKAGVLIPTYTS